MKTSKTTSPIKNLNIPKADGKHSLAQILSLMATLRGPSGCPWDREQTKQTLKKFLIEESYEVLEAIETAAPEALQEELGDLLLQIIFLSRIAEEKGEFDFSDVVHTLAEKLIRRHPHVFPPEDEALKALRPKSAKEVTRIWGTIKEREGKYANRSSLLDGLPLALPALEVARRMSERASKASPVKPQPEEPLWKEIEEGLARLREDKDQRSKRAVKTNLGDLLLALVHWARWKGFSAEEALRKANRRFAKGFARSAQKPHPKGETQLHPVHRRSHKK
jgi:tetrapyrrole methylase family protein/MazG family protein